MSHPIAKRAVPECEATTVAYTLFLNVTQWVRLQLFSNPRKVLKLPDPIDLKPARANFFWPPEGS